jgi:dienelactone hydrolase
MRNILPLVSLGCIAVIILGVITGGAVMLGYGLIPLFDKSSSSPTPKQPHEEKGPPAVPPDGPGPNQQLPKTLLDARFGFKTVRTPTDFAPTGEAPNPVADATIIAYKSGDLTLAAYLSNDRFGGGKRPAVVWAHGGFGSIAPDDWDRAKKFHDAGCVLMVPSFRQENNNPGKFEMFYGEVDDLLAAVDYVAKLPAVDPNRVYVVGYEAGGTLALLAATTGTTKVRAFFSILGIPDLQGYFREKDPRALGVRPPFIADNPAETRVRSALPVVGGIRRPTFFFGVPADALASAQAEEMQKQASRIQPPARFHAYTLAQAKAGKNVAPLVNLISRKILPDNQGEYSAIRFDPAELNALPFNK